MSKNKIDVSDEYVSVNLRIDRYIVEKMDEFRRKCRVPVTRTHFIKEAILEKVERIENNEK